MNLDWLSPQWWSFQWHQFKNRKLRQAIQRRETQRMFRDHAARCEIGRMRQLLSECDAAARRGVVISTTRHAARNGIDPETALVILQRLCLALDGIVVLKTGQTGQTIMEDCNGKTVSP